MFNQFNVNLPLTTMSGIISFCTSKGSNILESVLIWRHSTILVLNSDRIEITYIYIYSRKKCHHEWCFIIDTLLFKILLNIIIYIIFIWIIQKLFLIHNIIYATMEWNFHLVYTAINEGTCSCITRTFINPVNVIVHKWYSSSCHNKKLRGLWMI